jgi:hypothetical protein
MVRLLLKGGIAEYLFESLRSCTGLIRSAAVRSLMAQRSTKDDHQPDTDMQEASVVAALRLLAVEGKYSVLCFLKCSSYTSRCKDNNIAGHRHTRDVSSGCTPPGINGR